MYDIIKLILKKEKALTVLKNQVIEDRLVFRLVEFMDIDGNFKSLFVCYNLEFVFSETLSLIGTIDSKSLTDKLRASIRVYKDKVDYIDNKIKLNKEFLQHKFDLFESELSEKIFNLSFDLFKVRSVTISWFPITTVIVNYNHNKKRQSPLVVLPGRVNYIEDCEPSLLDFKIKVISLLAKYKMEGDNIECIREVNRSE